jgi:hypothetical protein
MHETISVCSRVGRLLNEHDMSVAELQRQLYSRFRISVDPKTIYRLTRDDAIQRADLTVAAAIGAILGVGLDDLFDVSVAAESGFDGSAPQMEPANIRKLSELLSLQAEQLLTDEESDQLQRLLAEYTRAQVESTLHSVARERGISYDDVYREFLASLDGLQRLEKAHLATKNAEHLRSRKRQRGHPQSKHEST